MDDQFNPYNVIVEKLKEHDKRLEVIERFIDAMNNLIVKTMGYIKKDSICISCPESIDFKK